MRWPRPRQKGGRFALEVRPLVRPLAIAALLGTLAWLAAPAAALVMPQDVRIPPAKERPKPPPALFSHATHNAFACYVCHPSVFPQKPKSFTHQDMKRGAYCAHCHDGRSAAAVPKMKCGGCHVE